VETRHGLRTARAGPDAAGPGGGDLNPKKPKRLLMKKTLNGR
jgi:hypothetical protein